MSEAIIESPPISLFDRTERLMALIHKPLKSLSIISIFLVLLIACVDVFGRTFFHLPLPGAMELTELCMALMIFPMFSYVTLKDNHLNVEMFYRKVSEGTRALLDIISWNLAAVYISTLGFQLLEVAWEKMRIREHTYFLDLPLYVFIAFGAFCLLLMWVALILKAITVFGIAQQHKRTMAATITLVVTLAVGFLPMIHGDLLSGFSRGAIGGMGMLYLFALILIGMPIGLAMLIVGCQGILFVMPTKQIAMSMVGLAPYTSLTEIHLSVIPMFLLMGELALVGGISAELFRTANAWLGRLPGGLAVATVAGCAGFAAVCGESIPTAMTMAAVSLPEMRKKGYDPAFGAACLSLGGTLGILIPPSMGFIIYSIIVEESVGKLFMAGIIPGLLLVCVISGIIIVRAILNPELAPRGDYTPWRQKLLSLAGLIPMLLLFGVIIGGMLTGTCTPTEGGAVGSLAALLYAIFRGKVGYGPIRESFLNCALLTGKVFLILMGVTILGYFLAATRLPFAMADVITGMNAGPWAVLMGTVVLFIVLGCLMNVIPMIMLTLPAIWPTLMAMGFDPIWFGVICVLLMELGQITPPIGVLVFALSSVVPDVPVESIYKQVAPFFIGILVTIGLIIVFPPIATWLPNMLFQGI